jgi:hypothetical protein
MRRRSPPGVDRRRELLLERKWTMKMVRLLTNLAALAVSLVPGSPSWHQVAAQQPAEDTKPALQEALTSLERASWDAWRKRDGKFFETFLSDDHVEVGVAGPAGKTTVVAGVASPTCIVKSFSLDTFALTLFDASTAALTYHAQQDTTCGGVAVPSPVWVSSLYLKRSGRWQNALYQQTRSVK